MTPKQRSLASADNKHLISMPMAIYMLQDAGIISDHCTSYQDISDADCDRAVEFIEGIKL